MPVSHRHCMIVGELSIMSFENTLSHRTRWNWIVDCSLFVCALLCSVSGLYFLFSPQGGFRGGRNVVSNAFLGLSRGAWKDIHIYAGLLMIAIVVYHIIRHWDWIKCTLSRTWKRMLGVNTNIKSNGWLNVIINLILMITFLISSVSGLYFYLLPHGGQRGLQAAQQVIFLFTPFVWRWLHNWIGLALVIAAIIHLALHWGWIVKVTRRLLGISISTQIAYPPVLD